MFLFLENNIQHMSLLEVGTGFVVQRKTWETVVYKLLVAQPSRKMRQKILFFSYVLHLMVYGLDSMSMMN